MTIIWKLNTLSSERREYRCFKRITYFHFSRWARRTRYSAAGSSDFFAGIAFSKDKPTVQDEMWMWIVLRTGEVTKTIKWHMQTNPNCLCVMSKTKMSNFILSNQTAATKISHFQDTGLQVIRHWVKATVQAVHTRQKTFFLLLRLSLQNSIPTFMW